MGDDARLAGPLSFPRGRAWPACYHGRWWTAKELALLVNAAVTTAEVARRVGRSQDAVRQRRRRRAVLPTAPATGR